MPSGTVAYNAYDPLQQSFLAALGLGESSGPGAYTQGTGGTDLSSAPTDQYGFPQWGGFGNSHAAGEFQFQPATWDAVAAAHGLNFQNPADQNAGAWYEAQQVYTAKTGGSLSDDLAAGKLTQIQDALAGTWPSVTGNGATPGLAAAIQGGLAAPIAGGNPTSADTSSGSSSSGGGLVGWLSNQFSRIGLGLVGVVILLIALWWLLADAGVVPSAGQVAKTAVKVAAA